MTDYRTDFTPELQRFLTEVEHHTMTVLQDDGLYRHIRFRHESGTSLYGFDINTWPGYLAITGDVNSYTFARTADMFEFFGSGISGVQPGRINPGYWQEKIVAAGQPPMEHSPDEFTRQVVEYFLDNRHYFHPHRRELFHAIRDYVLDSSGHGPDDAAALQAFQFTTTAGESFEFGDAWEWNYRQWSPQYLRALHAIVWGIGQYQASKVEAVAHA